MIDFQNQTLTSKPLKEIINASILFRREETLDKLREYKTDLILNDTENEILLAKFSSWLFVLFEQNRSMLEEEWNNIKNKPYTEIKELEQDIESTQEEKILKAISEHTPFSYSDVRTAYRINGNSYDKAILSLERAQITNKGIEKIAYIEEKQ